MKMDYIIVQAGGKGTRMRQLTANKPARTERIKRDSPEQMSLSGQKESGVVLTKCSTTLSLFYNIFDTKFCFDSH